MHSPSLPSSPTRFTMRTYFDINTDANGRRPNSDLMVVSGHCLTTHSSPSVAQLGLLSSATTC